MFTAYIGGEKSNNLLPIFHMTYISKMSVYSAKHLLDRGRINRLGKRSNQAEDQASEGRTVDFSSPI